MRTLPFLSKLSVLLIPAIVSALPARADEVEPNGTSATATPLVLTGGAARIRGRVFPAADEDYYSFPAMTGDRVYAATQTLFDASASGDSTLTLFDTDGSTVIEEDLNDGTYNASSSTIAGAVIPADGTYFLRVKHNVPTGTIRPYDLYLQLRNGSPVAETEPNEAAPGEPLAAGGWMSGTISAVSPGEADRFSVNLNAGDTVFLSLDADPERDTVTFNPRLGLGAFGPSSLDLITNDASDTSPNSEAFFLTVKDAGTYSVYVDSIVAAGLGVTATYHLNVSVFPAPATPSTIYTSTDVPKVIPTGPGMVSSTLNIPDDIRIGKLRVHLNITHTFMADMDVHLVSPSGAEIGLFSDVGPATVGGPVTLMDIILDDDAALPFAFQMVQNMILQPELNYRLGWFEGVAAQGTWTLVVRDDATGDGGTINSWALEIIEDEGPPAATTIYSTDFESDDGGFTHSGVADEWERGLPAFNPITTANSGVNCWKTDLDNSYEPSSSQDLFSPDIDLTSVSGNATVIWAQNYHLESANFDHAFVEIQEVGGAMETRKVWEWQDATMNNAVGNPTTSIAESGGWALMHADITDFVGKTIRIRFHLDSDTTVQLAGWAIDDVSVTAGLPAPTFTTNPITVFENDAPVDLAAATGPDPAGGTFSGAGVDSMAGTFDPTGLPLGPNTVTYTVTDGMNSSQADVTVNIIEAPGLTVTTLDDTVDELDGQTSLREAIGYAGTLMAPQTVVFSNTSLDGAVNFHDGTARVILLNASGLGVDGGVSIAGPGADLLAIDADGNDRVFSIPGNNPTEEIVISDLTLTGGLEGGGGAIEITDGLVTLARCLATGNEAQNFGGVASINLGTLTILDSLLEGNTAPDAGGIFVGGGTVNLINSTLSGNTAPGGGGGGISVSGGALVITNSTISGNSADNGGGVENTGGTVTVANSIIAGNTATVMNPDVSGSFTDSGSNLVGIGDGSTGFTTSTLVGSTMTPTDPLLAPLGDHGGPTFTFALLPGSPAIDAGDDGLAVDQLAAALANDQRGFTRILKGLASSPAAAVDIGAYELFAAPEFANANPSVEADASPLNLATATGASPPGGVFAGPGVGAGLFNPAGLAPGIYGITYTVTDAFGVTNVAELTVEVLAGEDEGRLLLSMPRSLRFPATDVGGKSRFRQIKLRNRGDADLLIGEIGLRGRSAREFRLTGKEKQLIRPGAFASLRVVFRPTSRGPKRARIEVTSDGGTGLTTLIGLGRSKFGVIRLPRDLPGLTP